MANKLTTLGYTLKRLRDSGYVVKKLYTEYGEADPRAWTIVIEPKLASVFCTCFINDPYLGETFFEISDGGQYVPGRYRIKTSSFEVLVEHLVKHGIYGSSTLKNPPKSAPTDEKAEATSPTN
jgi:hypothetical protein